MADLRLRIFRLVEERVRSQGLGGSPTVRQIAEGGGQPLRNVLVTLKSSEAMGMVKLEIAAGQKDEDALVLLQPPAYIYLEQHLNQA